VGFEVKGVLLGILRIIIGKHSTENHLSVVKVFDGGTFRNAGVLSSQTSSQKKERFAVSYTAYPSVQNS